MAKKKKSKKGETKGRGSEKSLSTFYVILGVVAVAGIAAVGYAVGSNALGGTVTEPVELEGVESDTALFELARGVELGDPEAPVVVHEFADYQCPACGLFAAQIKPLLVDNYIDEGTVKFVFFDRPISSLHEHAFIAARAARCAGDQDRYWDYHDFLFGRQSRWSESGDPVDLFVEYAGELSLDEDAFERCVESDRFADVVTANLRLAERLGVSSTPTIFVNGRRVVNFRGYRQIADLIDAELGQGQGQ